MSGSPAEHTEHAATSVAARSNVPMIIGVSILLALAAGGLKGCGHKKTVPHEAPSVSSMNPSPAAASQVTTTEAPPSAPILRNGTSLDLEVDVEGTPRIAVIGPSTSPLCQGPTLHAPNMQFYWSGADGAEHLWKEGDSVGVVGYIWFKTTTGHLRHHVSVGNPGESCP